MTHLGATSGVTHLGTREKCGQCPPLTEKGSGHFKVDVSFYVDKVNAPTAQEAEQFVHRVLTSTMVPADVREALGDVDVHQGDTVEWDMEG
jgi:hypothetical protein